MIDQWRTIANPVTGEELTFVETAEETGGERTVLRSTLAPAALSERMPTVSRSDSSAWPAGSHSPSTAPR